MHNRFILTPYFLDEASEELEELTQSFWLVNRPHLGEGEKMARMSAINKSLSDCVFKAVNEEEKPISIAGDCCTAIGVLAGLKRARLDPSLIWFDAHGDFNTWETTPSGFLGGMPLAMIVGFGDRRLTEAVGLEILPEKKVILAGVRDLDPGEKSSIENSSIQFVPDVSSLPDYPLPCGPLYIHFDTDVLNPRDAPAMSYPVKGGPSADELKEVFRFINKTGRIMAVSMSSWNPRLEGAEQSKRVCMDLLDTLVNER